MQSHRVGSGANTEPRIPPARAGFVPPGVRFPPVPAACATRRTRLSLRHRLLPKQGGDCIASRMGMLRPVARSSTATIALQPCACAPYEGPVNRSGAPASEEAGLWYLAVPAPPESIPSETPNFAAACATVPFGQRRVLDFACSVNRCQSTFSARPPRFARPRGLAPPTSPESPPRLAARPGFAPPLGFYSPSKVILPSSRSGSRRGLASLRGRRLLRLRGVNGQPTCVGRGSPGIGSCLPIPQSPGLTPIVSAPGCPYGPFGVGFRGRIPARSGPEHPPKGMTGHRGDSGCGAADLLRGLLTSKNAPRSVFQIGRAHV